MKIALTWASHQNHFMRDSTSESFLTTHKIISQKQLLYASTVYLMWFIKFISKQNEQKTEVIFFHKLLELKLILQSRDRELFTKKSQLKINRVEFLFYCITPSFSIFKKVLMWNKIDSCVGESFRSSWSVGCNNEAVILLETYH